MIIFKIYIPEKVRNSQTTSENFFEDVFSTMLGSTVTPQNPGVP